jgi:hypothetical protein
MGLNLQLSSSTLPAPAIHHHTTRHLNSCTVSTNLQWLPATSLHASLSRLGQAASTLSTLQKVHKGAKHLNCVSHMPPPERFASHPSDSQMRQLGTPTPATRPDTNRRDYQQTGLCTGFNITSVLMCARWPGSSKPMQAMHDHHGPEAALRVRPTFN